MKQRRESGGGKQAAAAFLDYAQPLLESTRGPLELEERAQMLTLAFAVWNAVVFERAGRRSRLIEGLRATLNEPAEREILRFMVERKRNERPVDNRVVGDLDFVRGKGGEMDVRVSYAEYSAVADDPKLERIEAHILAGFGGPKGARAKSAKKSKGEPAKAADAQPAKPQGAKKQPGDEVDASEAELWRALYQRADELRALAPWTWMTDSEVFGVRIAGEGSVRWCCVMGAADELFGLAVYDGDAGYETHRLIQSDEDDAEEALYGADGFLVTFDARGELSALELARVKSSTVRFKGPHAWPRIERTRSGRLPSTIEREYAAQVTALLAGVLEIARERREKGEPLALDASGALPVWSSVEGGLRKERLVPAPPPPPNFPPVDEVAVERLMRAAKRSAEVLEYDIFPTHARVGDEAGGVFLPAVFALVDAENGVAHCCEIFAPERRHASAAAQLLKVLEARALIPAQVRVSRAWVRAAIKPTLDALSVRVAFADELPALEEFRTSMEDALERGELGA